MTTYKALIKLLTDHPHIAKQVYEKFPVSKAERKCKNEKATMDQLRASHAKKLIEQNPEKVQYSARGAAKNANYKLFKAIG